MGTWGEAYLTRLRGCAARGGQALEEISDRDRSVRLVEADARLVEEGFGSGVLQMAAVGRVQTRDARQAPAWLVAGDPPTARWASLPQLAAYVELLRLGYPEDAVRFATPEAELRLDLAVVGEEGEVLVLGAARAESLLLSKLEALVPTFEGEGSHSVRVALGCDAHLVATQLWETRAPYLWLVAPGTRRVLRVTYGRTITLSPERALPSAAELWPYGHGGGSPRIRTFGSAPEAACG